MTLTQDRKLSIELGQQLYTLREAATLTDVTLSCGKMQIPFPAHKVILSGSSRYFRKMFSSGWQEHPIERVDLPNIGPEAMEVVLPFLYKGEFKNIEEILLLKKVLEASHFLQINLLLEWCFNRLAEKLSLNNFLEIVNMNETFNDDGLTINIVTFFAQYFAQISETKDFLKLSDHQMKQIVEQVKPGRPTLDRVVQSLVRWAQAEGKGGNRDETLSQIIAVLDLQCISTEYLKLLLRQRYIQKIPHLILMLNNEATLRILNSIKIKEKPEEVKILVLGKKDGEYASKLYDVSRDKWSEPHQLPFVIELGMVSNWFEGYAYVFGQGDSNTWQQSIRVVRYCPWTNTIRYMRGLEKPVLNPSTAVLTEYIYVVDGRHVSNSPNFVQRYNPLSDTCESIPPTICGHLEPSVCSTQSHLFVVSFDGTKDRIERYDPENNQWTVVSSNGRKSISMCMAGMIGEKVIVAPMLKTNDYVVYASEMWQTKEFKRRRHEIRRMKSATLKGKEVLISISCDGILYFYDDESEKWSMVSNSGLKGGFNAYREIVVMCNI